MWTFLKRSVTRVRTAVAFVCPFFRWLAACAADYASLTKDRMIQDIEYLEFQKLCNLAIIGKDVYALPEKISPKLVEFMYMEHFHRAEGPERGQSHSKRLETFMFDMGGIHLGEAFEMLEDL